MKIEQTYQYKEANSIAQVANDYELGVEEYYLLYNFFVTYSVCGTQSFKKRSFIDYGWNTNKIICTVDGKKKDTDLGKTLKNCLNLYRKEFIFTEKNNLKILFPKNNLLDKTLTNYDTERIVMGITFGNKYMKLFYRMRNCLAHGKFALKFSSNKEKMIVLQDDDTHNVTARIVLKLQTLMELIFAIDKNKLIVGNIKADMIKTAA